MRRRRGLPPAPPRRRGTIALDRRRSPLNGKSLARLTSESSQELVRKLVERLHLSVPDRRRLPPKGAPLSQVIAAVEAVVRETGSFPAGVNPEGPFEGPMILKAADGFSVCWRGEVGYLRYETVRGQHFTSLTEAAKAVANTWHGGIDGIPIDSTG